MTAAPDLLDRVLAPTPPPFALLRRPDALGPGQLEVLLGEVSTPAGLGSIALPDRGDDAGGRDGRAARDRRSVLVIVPHRQIAERGFACVDDGAELVAMQVTEQAVLPLAAALARIPLVPMRLVDGHFEPDDAAYADTVRRIIAEEIGRGVGSNFVIRRSYTATIADYGPANALTFFRRLCELESGAYWTFVVHTGSRTFVGATPERHISLREGVAVMNPISGTYRYPPSGPTLDGLLRFLDDGKENDELYMVVDEELKMMARVCEGGGRVIGPRLKEMARLAHTEYLIEGRSTRDPRDILRETMFAPTVTGSPLESACRVIARHEPGGRGYYGGIIALITEDAAGTTCMDSAILIRTADIDLGGRLAIGVGGTLVRHSDPDGEVAETHAKAAALLAALGPGPPRLAEHPLVLAALARRNTGLGRFWLAATARPGNGHRPAPEPVPGLAGRTALVVDAEDDFTAMISHQLRSLGLLVTVRRHDDERVLDRADLVVMGPGPGDPRDATHPRITRLHTVIGTLLAEHRPFLAVCLSHQVLSRLLGLDVVRCPTPNQGMQREIDLFGERELVGFYNTFAARCTEDVLDRAGVGLVGVSRDRGTGEVHALRGPHFASLQFHAESVLTLDGPRILATRTREVFGL
ncbi:MAG TPA: anthranilate synthase family protein [Pseudonocardiaceae bacterium]